MRKAKKAIKVSAKKVDLTVANFLKKKARFSAKAKKLGLAIERNARKTQIRSFTKKALKQIGFGSSQADKKAKSLIFSLMEIRCEKILRGEKNFSGAERTICKIIETVKGKPAADEFFKLLKEGEKALR